MLLLIIALVLVVFGFWISVWFYSDFDFSFLLQFQFCFSGNRWEWSWCLHTRRIAGSFEFQNQSFFSRSWSFQFCPDLSATWYYNIKLQYNAIILELYIMLEFYIYFTFYIYLYRGRSLNVQWENEATKLSDGIDVRFQYETR